LFILPLVHIVDGVRSKPQTPRGTKFVSLHEDIPIGVNKVFANQPLFWVANGESKQVTITTK
jgi:hypothetical protein